MDRNSYENVLTDLELEIKSKRAKAENILHEISQIENAISVLQTKLKTEEFAEAIIEKTEIPINPIEIKHSFELVPIEGYSKENQSKISLSNATEKILESVGKPLHATELIRELENFGRFTDRHQLHGTIRKDSKNRFINLGGNTWDLRRRHEQPQTEQE